MRQRGWGAGPASHGRAVLSPLPLSPQVLGRPAPPAVLHDGSEPPGAAQHRRGPAAAGGAAARAGRPGHHVHLSTAHPAAAQAEPGEEQLPSALLPHRACFRGISAPRGELLRAGGVLDLKRGLWRCAGGVRPKRCCWGLAQPRAEPQDWYTRPAAKHRRFRRSRVFSMAPRGGTPAQGRAVVGAQPGAGARQGAGETRRLLHRRPQRLRCLVF